MKVVDITTFKIIEVPDNHIRCSVCGKHHAPESFSKTGDSNKQTRTNCLSCYEMPYDDMCSLSKDTEFKKKSVGWRAACDKLEEEARYNGYSVSVQELIDQLSKLDPNSRIIATQSGYYAYGRFADMQAPELEKEIDGVKFYSISHSSQDA